MPEPGVGVAHLAFGPRGSTVLGQQSKTALARGNIFLGGSSSTTELPEIRTGLSSSEVSCPIPASVAAIATARRSVVSPRGDAGTLAIARTHSARVSYGSNGSTVLLPFSRGDTIWVFHSTHAHSA